MLITVKKVLFNLRSLSNSAAGRTTEVELFSGTVLELGKKYEVDTPVNRYLYKKINELNINKDHSAQAWWSFTCPVISTQEAPPS